MNEGCLGFEGVRILALPEGLYRDLFTACLGFPPAGFHSTDYFSLFPWIFLFLTGYFLFLLRREEPAALRLAVYLLHQPLVYGLLFVLFGAMR